MPRFRDFPIKRKLMSISLLASGAAVIFACVGFVTYEYVSYREATLHKLASVGRVIAVNSGASVRFDDPISARLTLTGLKAESQILAACIYSANGFQLASYRRDEESPACPESSSAMDSQSAAQDGVVLRVPIVEEGETLGSIWIQAESISFFDGLGRYMTIIGLVMLASVGVAWLLSSKLQHFISQPIHRLVETAREISTRNDFSIRAEQRGNDELGLLIRSFNEMLAQIEERDLKLERNREQLEESVAQRTAGLLEAVDELHAEIDQRKKAEERIRFLAYYDVLTGLPNRQSLKENLVDAITEASIFKGQLALLFLDLDRFKEINDSFGHAAGDQLLRQVADRLLTCVRVDDAISHETKSARPASHTVSRQGGDEFTILLTRVRRNLDASRVATRILESLRDPFRIDDRDVVVGASIGIAVYPTDGKDADTLLKHADTAMYHAKASGRNDFQYFTDSMKEAALQKLTLENDLRRAVERKEFQLYYQPKVDLRSQQVIGVEALLRWNHPQDGMIRPSEFIHVAEDSGLIVPLGAWVLRAACQQCKEWRDQGLHDLRMAVNVSNLQFRKTALLATITSILEETRLDPQMLELEITESTMMDNEADAIDALKRLKDLGVQVALDDFGTGYSSLSYVRRLPLDLLKIDRSFIRELGVNAESASIVTAIIAMAQGLGLRVVAEGVETEDQADFLRAQGCDEVQGFLYSEPVNSDTMTRMLQQRLHGERGA